MLPNLRKRRQQKRILLTLKKLTAGKNTHRYKLTTVHPFIRCCMTVCGILHLKLKQKYSINKVQN